MPVQILGMQTEKGVVALISAGMGSSPYVLFDQLDPKTVVGHQSFVMLVKNLS